jgi:alpha-amylase
MRWIAVLALSSAVAGCVSVDPFRAPPPITNHVEDWRDEIIYQVLIDRFANGDRNNDYNVTLNDNILARYMGGDYQGVIDRADYLQALGVTAVWVSPIVVNVEEDAGIASYHGYWAQDFKNVNPHFGDIVAFRRMVDALHERDIKVILDIVTNHVGQLFYYDINRNGRPDMVIYGSGSQFDPDEFWEDPLEVISEWDPRYDPRGVQGWTSLGESGPAPIVWVNMPEINRIPPSPPEFHNDTWYNRRGRVTDWDVREQVERGDFPGGLKDLDTTNPDVRDALIDVFKFWITQTNIDGFRIDTVKHVDHAFWQQFAPAMRRHAADLGKEQFLMFGEIFDGDDARIGSYTFDGELDSAFWFSQKFQVFDDIFKRGQGTARAEALFASRAANYGAQPHPGGLNISPQQAMVSFIDNHDVQRFLFDAPGGEPALKAALVFLLTEDGIPCIYYGTEQGFDGGNDPANREPLWWADYRTDGDLFVHTATLNRVRRTYPALTRGALAFRWTSDRVSGEEDAHILAFEREHPDGNALVVINTWGAGTAHTQHQGSPMQVSFPDGTVLAPAFPPGDARRFTVGGGGRVRVEVGPHEGLVLVPERSLRPLID